MDEGRLSTNGSREIRESAWDEWDPIRDLYGAAFPDEDLRPLVHELLGLEDPVLSLVSLENSQIVAHVMFTFCRVGASDGPKVALLGPLAVAPANQKTGLGSALVNEGLARVKAAGAQLALVLGDPNYYSRFGFCADRTVGPPFPLPPAYDGAWQSISLGAEMEVVGGRLLVPKPWDNPSLWA
jgi:putative acetyltransferase